MLHQHPKNFGVGAFFGNQLIQESAIARVRDWPALGFCRYKMAEGSRKRNILAILTDTTDVELAYDRMEAWFNIPPHATERIVEAYNHGAEPYMATCAYRIVVSIPLGANLDQLDQVGTDTLEAVPEPRTWQDVWKIFRPRRWKKLPEDEALIQKLRHLPQATPTPLFPPFFKK